MALLNERGFEVLPSSSKNSEIKYAAGRSAEDIFLLANGVDDRGLGFFYKLMGMVWSKEPSDAQKDMVEVLHEGAKPDLDLALAMSQAYREIYSRRLAAEQKGQVPE
jgi:hypothetical protein